MSGNTKKNPMENDQAAFNRFMANSIIIGDPLSGSDGYLLRYRNTKDEVYVSTDVDDINTGNTMVDTILVKFIPMRKEIHKTTFNSEVHIQNDIYNTTKDGLEPLCPAILFYHIYKKDDSFIANYLKYKYTKDKERFKNASHIGVIAMEFVNYIVMKELLIKFPSLSVQAYMVAAFLIIELAIQTGYTQGDFHFRNIFFKVNENLNYPYFLTYDNQSIEKLKPLIIDFGRAKKIAPITMYKIHQLDNNFKFREIMGLICYEGSSNNPLSVLEFPSHFGWASGLQVFTENNYNYLRLLELDPGKLTFFKNGKGAYEQVNLKEEEIKFLNNTCDGINGFMRLLIMARDNSRDRIATFKETLKKPVIYNVPDEPAPELIRLDENEQTLIEKNLEDVKQENFIDIPRIVVEPATKIELEEDIPRIVVEPATKIEAKEGISENINKPEHLPYDVRSTIATPKKGLFSRLSKSVSKAASRVGRALYIGSAGRTRKKNKRRTKRRKRK